MSETATQSREIFELLTGIKEEVIHLKEDMHHVLEYIEDSRLSEEEKLMVGESLVRIKKGEKFISHEQVKKELGL